MKLTRTVLANAFALTTAIFWVVCGLFIWLLPDFSLTVTRWWFMGLDIGSLGGFSLDFGTFLLGGITFSKALNIFSIIALIISWLGSQSLLSAKLSIVSKGFMASYRTFLPSSERFSLELRIDERWLLGYSKDNAQKRAWIFTAGSLNFNRGAGSGHDRIFACQ